jgi:hypothetical protein
MPNLEQVTIRLDLAAGAKKGSLSSDNYSNLVQGVLVPLDLLYTYAFRYGRLIANDLPSANGFTVSTQGPMIDYTAQHPIVGAAVTVAFVGVAAATTYSEYRRQQKIAANSSYKSIFDTFDKASAPGEVVADDNMDDINDYLLMVLEEDKLLRDKYEVFAVDLQNKKFVVVLKDKKKEEDELAKKAAENKPGLFKKFTSKVLSPVWEALCLSSFTYWIMWISAGIFTGQFGLGIAGLPNIIGFGLPILAGLAYPVIKIYNHFKNKRKTPQIAEAPVVDEPQASDELTRTTEIDACALLRRALLRREFELQKKALRKEITALGREPNVENVAAENIERSNDNIVVNSIDEKITGLTKGKWKKTAITFISVLGGTYVAAQYGAWIITDILNSLSVAVLGIPMVNIILGAGLLAIAGIYGIYKAVERYREVGKFQKNEKIAALKNNQAELNDLETRLANHQKNIAANEKTLGLAPAPVVNKYVEEQFFNDITRKGPTKWTTFKKVATRAFHFVNGVCTGIFLGRLFLVKGTAIALPFAAAMLSNPITIGVLCGIGLLYGAFKMYQYHERRKEERAKLLFEQRAERIACLKQEVELAGLRDQLLSIEAEKKVAADNVALEQIKEADRFEQAVNSELTSALVAAATPVKEPEGNILTNGIRHTLLSGSAPAPAYSYANEFLDNGQDRRGTLFNASAAEADKSVNNRQNPDSHKDLSSTDQNGPSNKGGGKPKRGHAA